ncbi:MAG: sensor histidine kinase [Clostridiales bacterium]|nr:sensor histidine kinase [Clostridiales bacterium]
MRNLNNLPIGKKFLLLYLLGVLLPIAVLLAFVLTNVADEIRTRELLNARQSLERVYTTLNMQFSSAVSLGNVVSGDSKLASLMQRNYQSPAEYYHAYINEISPILNRYSLAYAQHMIGLTLVTDNPTIANGGVVIRITPQVQEQEWFPDVLPADTGLKVYLRQQVGLANILQLCLTRMLHTGSPYTELLRIDLNMEPINSLIAKESSFLSLYLVAPDGTAVCYPGSLQNTRIADRSIRPPEPSDLSMSFGERSAMQGWKLMAYINDEPKNTNIRQAVWVGLLLGAVCSVFAAAMAFLFSRSISLRSQRLLAHMDNMTAENFTPITREAGRDEIGELTAHFNEMGARLKQLINDLYVLQLRQKSLELENVRAQLKYLQVQIDPHFLFNTLNGILVLSVRNGHHEEAEILRALSKILRRMLDSTRDIVTLQDEMEFVRMVLKIEQFRFGDKLQYDFDLHQDALSRTVPVMSVQGLVENACKHGIQSISGQGMIRVKAWVEADGTLVIQVRDNGIGIPPGRLKELQERIASPQDMPESLGLQNIYRRLLLHYGNSSSLTLTNAQERGTMATLRIPRQEGE